MAGETFDETSFVSQEELAAKFEDPKPFRGHDIREAIGRFDWQLTRKRAEFFLFLAQVGINREHVAAIMNAYDKVELHTKSFVFEGLQTGRRRFREQDVHPLSLIMNELTDDSIEVLYDQLVGDETESLRVDQADEYWDALADASDEDILHELQKRVDQSKQADSNG